MTLLSWEAAQEIHGGHPTRLFCFICHFVVTVFTFVQRSPGRFLQHWDQSSVMCSQLPQTKDLHSQKLDWLRQWGKILCNPCDSNQVSQKLPVFGSLLPFGVVLTGAWPLPTFRNHLTSPQGFWGLLCSLASLRPCLRVLVRPSLLSNLPSWTLLFASPLPLVSHIHSLMLILTTALQGKSPVPSYSGEGLNCLPNDSCPIMAYSDFKRL